jgi:cytochrome c6
MKKLSVLHLVAASAIFLTLCAVPWSSSVVSAGLALRSPHKNPSDIDAAALFGEKCAMCHGKNGAGLPNWKAKGQPDFTKAGWQKSHTDEQIAEAIRNGKGKFMNAYRDKLSAEEISALVGRIRGFAGKK